jgi:hypothetical protein
MPSPVIIGIVLIVIGLAQFLYYSGVLYKISYKEYHTKKQVLIDLIPGKFICDLFVYLKKTIKNFNSLPLK